MRRKHNQFTRENGTGCGMGCGVLIFAIALNMSLGGIAVNEILSWFSRNIPWQYDALVGLFVAEATVPIAIAGKILRMCGVF